MKLPIPDSLPTGGLLIIILTAYACFLWNYTVPSPVGVDQNGYFVSAQELAKHGRFHQLPDDDFVFIGRMWVVNERGEFYPKYPPLYPALLGSIIWMFGDEAASIVSPVSAVAALAGLFFLAQLWVRTSLALLAVFLFMCNPIWNLFAISQMSHATSLCFIIWGYYIALLSLKQRGSAAALLGLVGGLLVGYSAGIRYTNVLLALPPLVLLWPRRFSRKSIAGPAGYIAGTLPSYIFLAIYHFVAFGAPWRTGYALTSEQSAFSLQNFIENSLVYFGSSTSEALGPVSAVACFGFVSAFRKSRRRGIFFTMWIVPIFVVYSTYYWGPEQLPLFYLRFLLPAFAAFTILAALFFEDLFTETQLGSRTFPAVVALFSIWLVTWSGGISAERIENQWKRREVLNEKAQFIRTHVPKGAVIFGPVILLNTIDFHREYDLYSEHFLIHKLSQRQLNDVMNTETSSLQPARSLMQRDLLKPLDSESFADRAQKLYKTLMAKNGPVYLATFARASKQIRKTYSNQLKFKPVAKSKPLLDQRANHRPLTKQQLKTLPPIRSSIVIHQLSEI